MNRLAVIAAVVAGGCQGTPKPPAAPAETATTREDAASRRARLFGELQDDILTSYDRDEPPDQDSAMIDPKVGGARIGAGPGDVYIAGDLAHAPSRWPLDVDHATRTEVRSKNLAIHIAADQSAAWMTDELSWRIEMCGRTATIPLRVTALFAHDGDRWISVFEHLSYGRTRPTPPDTTLAKAITTAVSSAELEAALQATIERSLLRGPRDPAAIGQDETSLVLGPDAADEWAGSQVLEARLPAGQLEQHRAGTVGQKLREPTIAYWVGNYLAELPARPPVAAGTARMRVTFVFEKRPVTSRGTTPPDPKACQTASACRWVLVQSHMSQPINDDQLTEAVFGTALISPKPLVLDCSDGSLLIAPAVGPRQAPRPPAAQIR
jgi:hypothetical protein